MSETTENNIKELYIEIIHPVTQIYDIFKDFYGEDKVDLQKLTLEDFKHQIEKNYSVEQLSKWDSTLKLSIKANFTNGFILVYFPTVRVTNEHDRFVDIKDLYVKVPISIDGTMNGRFSLNRANYHILHMLSGYMHSHVPGINTYNFEEFLWPCLGSGPINSTITSLNRDFDKDLWELFCFELNLYVRTESVSGVPYRFLEHIGSDNNNNYLINSVFEYINSYHYYAHFSKEKYIDFLKYFINTKKLKFNFNNGQYSIAMSYIDYMILISNEFIKWYNQAYNEKKVIANYTQLLSSKVLYKVIIKNNKIYQPGNSNITNIYPQYVGKKICTFKNKEILLQIEDLISLENTNEVTILNPQLALYLLTQILKVINFKYGNTTTDSNNTESTNNQIRKTTKFI